MNKKALISLFSVALILSFLGVAQAQKSDNLMMVPATTRAAVSSASSVSPAKALTTIKKCGVNGFGVNDDCGFNAFKSMYFECYDGYSEKMGDDTSCKSSETWQEYSQSICANRCYNVQVPVADQPNSAIAIPAPTPIPAPSFTVPNTNACYNNDLVKAYSSVLNELQKAQASNNINQIMELKQKVTIIKGEISKNGDQCGLIIAEVPGQKATTPKSADQCSKLEQWKKYLDLYDQLISRSEEEFKSESGYTKEEATKLIVDLRKRYKEVSAQCNSPAAVSPVVSTSNPILPSSVKEIDTYYQAKMNKIIRTNNVASQVKEVANLQSDVSNLVGNFIKSRKEVEASELSGMVKQIKIEPGLVKADNTVFPTIDKKIFTDVGVSPISIEPAQDQVIINDQDIKVDVQDNISISESGMQVGGSEVKLSASSIASNLNVIPTTVSLHTENGQAVYEMRVDEPRRLFGLFKVNLARTITANAQDGKILKEKKPWYSFLTSKSK